MPTGVEGIPARSPRTALHEAANRGFVAIVKALVENGADTSVADSRWGGNAAGWAEAGGYEELAGLLRREK